MPAQEPTSAPPRFLRILRKEFAGSGISLREVARKAEISPAYLSRLMAGERGVPGDDIIARLEEVLAIEPRGQLFDAARRHDAVVTKVLDRDNGRPLMRSLAPLTAQEFDKVVKLAQDLARKHQEPRR